MKKKLKIPKFAGETAERKFWGDFDLSAYFEPEDFVGAAFPNLKPTSRAISLRVPEFLLMRLKEQANELHVPYQSLMKRYIAEGVVERQ